MRASSSTACARCARSTSMPEAAVHLASGKVRELYALDDERLLLVASDRISTFDVILPTEIPDKGRVLTGLSAFWFALTREIVPNHLLALRDDGRSLECRRLEMLPGRGGRARLSLRLGLEGLSRDRFGLRARAPRRARRVGSAAGADRHPGDEGRLGPRREHRRARRSGARRRRALGRGRVRRARALRLRLPARGSARDRPRRHEVRARARPGRGRSCSETRR